ncbi:hypothetical protein [Rhizobium sp. 60-20]|uniref:hypothetical protein n=1 Tax=Rhizobium sp. 60-20 TaxID=1895819 RepID=UPI000929029D|nr:hypothetical protein [Rhizobium sp. 60-20]OJY66423.1 MAG: hypothetical protein BGP09_31340 [Rhizobium sp. 60-20]
MTFSEAYAVHGPDTIAISRALDIPEHEADRRISEELNKRHVERVEKQARKTAAYNQAYNVRRRSRLREIRAGRSA